VDAAPLSAGKCPHLDRERLFSTNPLRATPLFLHTLNQFMMGPAIFTAFDYLFQLPMFARFHRKPDMRQCLTNYYRKVKLEMEGNVKRMMEAGIARP